MTTSRAALARAARSARLALTHAGPDRDTFFQLCKAALATVLAGQFALRVIHSATPFYAPMAAFLVVDRTMVRSLWASAAREVVMAARSKPVLHPSDSKASRRDGAGVCWNRSFHEWPLRRSARPNGLRTGWQHGGPEPRRGRRWRSVAS